MSGESVFDGKIAENPSLSTLVRTLHELSRI